MGNFGQKIDKFIEIFLEQNGYVKVIEGLLVLLSEPSLQPCVFCQSTNVCPEF